MLNERRYAFSGNASTTYLHRVSLYAHRFDGAAPKKEIEWGISPPHRRQAMELFAFTIILGAGLIVLVAKAFFEKP